MAGHVPPVALMPQFMSEPVYERGRMNYQWIQGLLGARRQSRTEPRSGLEAPAVPSGHRVYAVGDIHGRADLLRRLQATIASDAAKAPANMQQTVVYLGDYVDRGLESQAVIDLLLAPPPEGLASICLKGNHEEAMLLFLADVTVGPAWFAMGGDATAYSYGVGLPKELSHEARFAHVWRELRASIPAAHLAFLSGLPLTHAAGDYLFVHAGVRPGVPLDQQRPDDLLWIRDQFLTADEGWDKIIVHGHSVTHQPESLRNRIGVDTGAYVTNVLTCVVLEGSERRFLST